MRKQEARKTTADKRTVAKIICLLEEEYPDAKVSLHYSNPFELLIATILSAQVTDQQANKVTETLFKKYRKPEDFAGVDVKELEQIIRPAGFYHNKAKNIMKCCQMLMEKYHSQIPKTMKEMLELPGVARKTANIVLSNAFGVIEGIAVDTHVRRVAQRLELTENENADKIEHDLMKLTSKDKWKEITDLFIALGRRVCTSQRPKCEICVLNDICPSAFTFE